MMKQHDADLLHDRLHQTIMVCAELARPSAITGMLHEALNTHGQTNGTPTVLASILNDVVSEMEKNTSVPVPSFWQEVISETYYRMFYTLDSLEEHGLEFMAEDGNLQDYTDWLVASLRGESVPQQWNVREGVH